MTAVAWILVVVAVTARVGNALPLADYCISVSSGTTSSYAIPLNEIILDAGTVDWQVIVPDLSYCPTVVGVTAVVCDKDAVPEAHFENPKLIFVHRVYALTPAGIQLFVYCQSNPRSLKHSNLLKSFSQSYSSLFPQSLFSNSLSDSSKSIIGRHLHYLDHLTPQAKAVPLSTGLNLKPLYGNSDLSVLDQLSSPRLSLTPHLGQSHSHLRFSAQPKLSVTPLLNSASPQLSRSSLYDQYTSSLGPKLSLTPLYDQSSLPSSLYDKSFSSLRQQLSLTSLYDQDPSPLGPHLSLSSVYDQSPSTLKKSVNLQALPLLKLSDKSGPRSLYGF